MAVDLGRNNITMESLNKFEDRINKAESELNDIFSHYKIPDDVKDYNEKLGYALSEIGDKPEERKELKKKFEDAQKAFQEKSNSLREDFLFAAKNGKKNLEKISNEIKAEEERLRTDEAEKASKEERSNILKEEIEKLNVEKKAIGGDDGKGGQVAGEKAICTNLKKEQENITKDIKKIEAEIAEIVKKISELNDRITNSKDQSEIDKCSADIAVLEVNKVKLNSDEGDLSNKFQYKETEKKEHEKNIRDFEKQYADIDDKIGTRVTEKNRLDAELKILPSRSGAPGSVASPLFLTVWLSIELPPLLSNNKV
jgi:predicted  nucleic acid-binding Zn-ribbon protein